MGNYQGKRFAAFLCTIGALVLGLIIVIVGGQPTLYTAFATAIGVALTAYVGGQSTTDWKETKNGVQHE